MAESKSCNCSSALKLIFPCSGAADVGEIADHAARQLTREGVGKMYCLAGIGGRAADIVANTGNASVVLAIDGCGVGCASMTLKEAGFSNYVSLQLTDLFLLKGSSPASADNVDRVAEAARQVLSRS